MKLEKTSIAGAYTISRPINGDSRGYFSRLCDVAILRDAGIDAGFVQMNLSQNKDRATLRGLHSQTEGNEEDKLVTCTRGEIWDVCIDMRADSPTFRQYAGEYLSEKNGKMLYVPKGCAHGYITLTEDAQVLYFVTQYYTPESEKGYRYDDPSFGIKWPVEPRVISEKDKGWAFL